MKLRLTAGALALALVLAACGDDDDEGDEGAVRACAPDPPNSEAWTGEPEADLSTGEVQVDAFNEYLAGADAPVSTSPCDAAGVFLHLDRAREGTTADVAVEPENSATATVTVTLEGLADDSIAAQRWTLEFEPGEGDAVRLASGTMAFRCQPGRGHQKFSTTLCL